MKKRNLILLVLFCVFIGVCATMITISKAKKIGQDEEPDFPSMLYAFNSNFNWSFYYWSGGVWVPTDGLTVSYTKDRKSVV